LIDAVVLGLAIRFEAAKCIDSLFCFLYKFQSLTEEGLTSASQVFAQCTRKTPKNLVEEMILLSRNNNE